MGTGTEDGFIAAYQDAINRIRQLQPNAIFYVMGILSVTQDLADTDQYVTLDAIKTRNADLAALADGKHIFYIDVYKRQGTGGASGGDARLHPARDAAPNPALFGQAWPGTDPKTAGAPPG